MNFYCNELARKMVKDSLDSGSYFFDKDTMRFWGSRIVAGMYKNNAFVTIEDNFDRTSRMFTVMQYDWKKHEVIIIGKFMQYDNFEEAVKVAKSLEKLGGEAV